MPNKYSIPIVITTTNTVTVECTAESYEAACAELQEDWHNGGLAINPQECVEESEFKAG